LILTESDEVVKKAAEVVKHDDSHLNTRQRGVRARKAITSA